MTPTPEIRLGLGQIGTRMTLGRGRDRGLGQSACKQRWIEWRMLGVLLT